MVMSRANFSKMTRSAPAKGTKMKEICFIVTVVKDWNF